jgi:phosphatidate cytidylyltransferase
MKERAITGVIFVIVLISSLLLGKWSFALFFMLISLLSLDEFYKIVNKDEIKPNRVAGLFFGLALLLLFAFLKIDFISINHFLYLIPFMTLVFWWELYRKAEKPFINIAYTFLGIIFTVIPFLFFINIGFLDEEYNFHYPLGFLILLWASDTGAYLTGMKFGKTKLFERHSPKKTWEGFFGGMTFSVIASIILSQFYLGIEMWQWIVSSVLIVVFGTYGDLSESMLKRSYQIKDSGKLLPGHGGLLDRFDGLLLAAPLVYAFWALTM